MKLPVAQSAIFECFFCARRPLTWCLRMLARRVSFCVEARTRLRRASATGHSAARPGQATPHPTVTASLAKCRAPNCCYQLASACRPLHVAFQAASRGRGPQGFSDPGCRAKEKGPGREGQPRRRRTRSREALRTRGPTKTRAPQPARRRPRSDACGVYIVKEDGARIGQPGRETTLLRGGHPKISRRGCGSLHVWLLSVLSQIVFSWVCDPWSVSTSVSSSLPAFSCVLCHVLFCPPLHVAQPSHHDGRAVASMPCSAASEEAECLAALNGFRRFQSGSSFARMSSTDDLVGAFSSVECERCTSLGRQCFHVRA